MVVLELENTIEMLTVNTASDRVPMMKVSELLYFSMNGGVEPCCVSDKSQFGRGIVSQSLYDNHPN